MLIYSNGCSHTAGHCVNYNHTWVSIIMRSIIGDKNYEINPKKVSPESDVLINQSMFGAGNDYIFHQSLEAITNLINNGNKPDYVFIQWSGPNRREHCLPNGESVFVNLHDNFEYGIKFEPMGSKHTLHYIFLIQEFLDKHKIKFVFFNYMGFDLSIKNNILFDKINLNNLVDFGFGNEILYKGLLDYMKENDMSCDKDGHPNIKGNFFIADGICKKIGIELIKETNFFKLPYV